MSNFIRNIVLLAIVFSMLCVPPLLADDNHAMPVLRMGVGARALGMGGAYIAEVKDASATYWNPAGLTEMEHLNITGMFSSEMSYERNHNFLAYGRKFGFGALAMGWISHEVRGVHGYSYENLPTSTFREVDNVFMFSYARKIGKFSSGANFKIVDQRMGDYLSETGIGFDLGVRYSYNDDLVFGAVVKDIATKVGGWTGKYEVWKDRVPANFGVGAVVYPYAGFTFPVDVYKVEGREDMALHFGGEYTYKLEEKYSFSLRAGSNDGQIAFGFGLKFVKFTIDYAFMNEQQDFLKENHKFSFSADF
ncbi:MAG TPA: PorV/PorQ family protein [candidate division Zixibacteria bacterium]